MGLYDATAQDQKVAPEAFTAHNKGKFFVSWGGNRENYSKSDITFKGADYSFTLNNVAAHDKPKGWHVDYINPARMTIPQTNFRMGYFIDDHYSIAVGVDHMKYVMTQEQTVNYNGQYPNKGTYNETVVGDPNQVLLTRDFLTFEHTDGLNYVNTEFSRHDDVSAFFRIHNTDKIQVNLTEGVGMGLLYPKTNAKVLSKDRHDDFHVSGFGASIKAGLNVTFFKYFYVQAELKGGYINMQDIRTTQSSEDSASQDFFFFQRIIAFGGIFRL
ncbi:hypothetical protein [Flavobacterium crassostreae]|uniref:Outer membrane protein beta-barrel domain-containing protein n=1 Tax=Flavobacterium crassostreae TaxID=1763534 RepID=A0A1B9E9S4_9FLAO|nr:hypothetical protein [Flavobacterium crassostreae]OCB78641.1 hypothetical protein LPBF_01205 [Flavobacterium crassostreae]